MKKFSRVFWGLVLIAAGVALAFNAIGMTQINVFFDGWWTLLIIIPCFFGLFTARKKTLNLLGILLGVLLLLCCQGILTYVAFWKLLLPIAIVIIGMKLVFSGIFGMKTNKLLKQLKLEGKKPRYVCATFSGCNLRCDGEVFEGADLTAAFGNVKCDLRNAVITTDCAIQTTAVFGGIQIFLPDNINVKVCSDSVFGGISNKTKGDPDAPTIYISGGCLFGGVNIK